MGYRLSLLSKTELENEKQFHNNNTRYVAFFVFHLFYSVLRYAENDIVYRLSHFVIQNKKTENGTSTVFLIS